jgi:peptidoglycan hydrolase-like protein with peptidoglycan-binding domain
MASGAHTKKRDRTPMRGLTVAAIVIGAAAAVVAVAGATYAAGHKTGKRTSNAGAVTPTTAAPVPLTLVSSSPAANAGAVAATSPITLNFSAFLSASGARPTITPPTAGSWVTSGSTMTFVPAGGWVPYSTVTVTVPSGLAGAAGTNTTPLATAASVTFTVAPGSTLRLQQLLAQLGYLPVAFTPGSTSTGTTAVSTSPVAGTFSWRYANTPASLRNLWAQGQDNVIDRGAIMAFEAALGLATDGAAGPEVWRALVAAAAQHQVDTQPYNYLMVSESEPESLEVWSDGQIVASSAANTGIAAAPTAQGTFPVYARYQSTTMSGVNPDGTHYSDPGVRWVAYFNGGDAVHEFPRPGYGWPQSLGCVELPSSTAETIWGLDPIGTLVTVA